MQKKFEYKILDIEYNTWTGKPTIDIEATLNQLGLEGWELVSVPYSKPNTSGLVQCFIFKKGIIH